MYKSLLDSTSQNPKRLEQKEALPNASPIKRRGPKPTNPAVINKSIKKNKSNKKNNQPFSIVPQ
jgi:hypothetical protein